MKIETWTSDQGGKEVHHFCEGNDRVYLFGLNVDLLGDEFYANIKRQVEERIGEIQDEHTARFEKMCEESGITKQFLEARNKERTPFDD